MASFRLLSHLARMFEDRIRRNEDGQRMEIDRKLRQKIEEKKQAHGLKMGKPRKELPCQRNIFISQKQEKEQARQIDIAELLRSQGEALKRSGSEYEWKDGSQKVTIRGNLWFHQYERTGGDAIDFVRRFYNKSYPEAMEYLLGGCSGTLAVSPPMQKKPPKPFVLPPKNVICGASTAYLINPQRN